ncbi:unnamed protein product [Urochloa decumbens]|uniref:F-box domain-containing protein n=1 Tax=Urochloa decumbens TaxID=240449 RepID=A0ABC9FN73_9POAL
MVHPRRQPPELTADLIGEIVLRLPPEDPACLVRASLVCNLWRGIISDRTFPRRYREFHRTAPMLGFFDNLYGGRGYNNPRFIPITAASPFSRPESDSFGSLVLDSHHGRVLLRDMMDDFEFAVWDPISDHRQQLPKPIITGSYISNYNAVVLCGADCCDHLDCHGGPFLVVLMCNGCSGWATCARVYSSKTGAWGAPASVHSGLKYLVNLKSVIMGDKIYSIFRLSAKILMYDIGKHYLSMIDTPDNCGEDDNNVLMSLEDGSLGLADIRNSSIYLWSRKVNNSDGVARWMQCRIIELEKMIPAIKSRTSLARVIGFAEGVCAILVSNGTAGTFMIELKSGMVRKINQSPYDVVVPFLSFYTPRYFIFRPFA